VNPSVDQPAAEREPDHVTPADDTDIRVALGADLERMGLMPEPEQPRDISMDAARELTWGAYGMSAPTGDPEPPTPAEPEPERRTVSLECMTDELRELLPDETERSNARVGLVLRIGGRPVAVPDTDAPWRLVHDAWPIKILRGLLSEMVSGKSRLERDGEPVEVLMPTPDVLAALDGRPDARLLTAPVWVLAMDITPGMLLAPESGPDQPLVTSRPRCMKGSCVYGSCAPVVADGREEHQSGYARVRVRIPAAATR
jgi:hypothetical protein